MSFGYFRFLTTTEISMNFLWNIDHDPGGQVYWELININFAFSNK